MEVTVRCPSGREPDFSVRCQADWRVSELKQHLASAYPGCPAADTQRIIFAGRLLANEEALEQALGTAQHSAASGSTSRVVHLVLPGDASAATLRSASAPAMTSSSQSQHLPAPDELTALWQEYTQYVHSHYLGCCLAPSAAGSAPLSAAAAAAAAPNPPAVAAAVPQQQLGGDDQDGGGVEIGADGAVVGVAGGGVGGFREWVHMALRCGLMSLIIFYYSSPGKALSAFAIFFAMQAVQGGFLHRLRRLVWAGPQQQQQQPAEEAVAAAAAAAPAAQETPQQRRAPQQASGAPAAAVAAAPHASLTATLAAFLDALLTTIVAFFTSLIPDRPPPLANQ